jgi:hypothetical protein
MSYLVAGRTVLIETSDEWAHRAVSEIFSAWFFNLIPPDNSREPNATIQIHCHPDLPSFPSHLPGFAITNSGTCFTDESSYYLVFSDAMVVFGTGNKAKIDLWVTQPHGPSSRFVQLLSHALSPALRRSGIFEIHSAGVIPPQSKSAVMIAGASGSGKSTLTTQLARSGWDYLSDDILVLTAVGEELHLHAFRRFFALTDETLAAVHLGAVKTPAVDSKHRVIPQDHFRRAPVETAVPRAIVFPTIIERGDSQIRALTPGETMSRLLRLCPWASYDKGTSVEHLRVLGRLANSSSGFDLLAGPDIMNDSHLTARMFFNITDKAISAY